MTISDWLELFSKMMGPLPSLGVILSISEYAQMSDESAEESDSLSPASSESSDKEDYCENATHLCGSHSIAKRSSD